MTCGYDEQQAKRRGNQRMRVHGIMWAVMVLVHWVGDLTITTFLGGFQHYYLERRCSRSNEPEPKQECSGRAPRPIRFLYICVVPPWLNQRGQASFAPKCSMFFSGLDRVRRCLEPQILQSQVISLHHRIHHHPLPSIAIDRKQHDRYGIFGHCDEDVGKNLMGEVLRHVSILGVPPLNHVSRWSSRLQTRPKGQSHF